MKKGKKAVARKTVVDFKDKLEAYRASAIAVGKPPGWTKPGNLAWASAAAGGAALAVAPAAEAVIQYSGPQNISVTSGYIEIDVDNDGNNDLVLIHYPATTLTTTDDAQTTLTNSIAFLYPLNGASVIYSGLYTFNEDFPIPIANALTPNYNIASSDALAGNGSWIKYPNLLGYNNYGQFPGQGNKYLGVRFTNDGTEQSHYGWVQVNVAANNASLTIVDWAWENIPEIPILAGATSTTVIVIPTLNEWGLIVLMTLLAGAAAWKMNRPEPLLQA